MYTKIITQTFKKSNFKYSHLFLSKKDFVIQYAYPNKLSPDAYFNIGAFDYLLYFFILANKSITPANDRAKTVVHNVTSDESPVFDDVSF